MQIFNVVHDQLTTTLFGYPVQDLAIVFIFIALWQAIRSARAATEANELASLPCLVLSFDNWENLEPGLQLQNIGRGPAVAIRVESWRLIVTDSNEYWDLFFEIPDLNALEASKFCDVTVTVKKNNEDFELVDFMKWTLRDHEDDISLPIFYTDLRGHEYITISRLGRNKAELSYSPKRYNLIRKVRFGWQSLVLNELELNAWKTTWINKSWYGGKVYFPIPKTLNASIIILSILISVIALFGLLLISHNLIQKIIAVISILIFLMYFFLIVKGTIRKKNGSRFPQFKGWE